MKKHKGLGVLCIVGIVFLIGGGIVLGAGVASGGSLRYLSVNRNTVSWWPFEYGSIGIGSGFDFDDFDILDVSSNAQRYTQELGDVKTLQINVDAGDVEIRQGSSNYVEYETRKKSYISIENNNGNAVVNIDHSGLSMHNIEESIVVYVSDNLYEEIQVNSSLGDIVVHNVRAKSFNIELALGDVDISNIYSEGFILNQKCGDIDIEGTLLNTSKISNKLGDSDVTLKGDAKDYRYTINNTLGDSDILDDEREGHANVDGGYMDAKHQITIENTFGDIDFDIE